MRGAPAALLVALLAAGCSPATGTAVGRTAAVVANSEGECAAPPDTLAPGRVQQVTRVAGVRPAPVVDRAEILSAADERELTERSRLLEGATTDQVVVVTVPELAGLSIQDFALTLANHWGLGRADADNGVLILVAPTERRVRIAVGCGLEALLTDRRAADIVDKMTPLFRRWEYDKGVRVGFAGTEKILRSRPGRPYVR